VRSELRLLVAAALIPAWLLLLFTGHPFGGATHLLLVAALVVFPWRAARAQPPVSPDAALEEESQP
jgi:hypothetical protein